MNSTSAHYLLRVASFHFSSSFITQYFKSPRLALAQGFLASQPPPSLIRIITGPGLQLTPSHKNLARIDTLAPDTCSLSCLQSWVAAANIVCKMCHGPDRGDQMLQTYQQCHSTVSSCQHLGDRDPISNLD